MNDGGASRFVIRISYITTVVGGTECLESFYAAFNFIGTSAIFFVEGQFRRISLIPIIIALVLLLAFHVLFLLRQVREQCHGLIWI